MNSTVDPVLYTFRRCPYAMRARMALAKARISCVHREVVLRRKPPELLAASPKGTVPVLVLEDGQVIDESVDVMRWALAQHDPEGWLEGDPSQTAALFEVNDRDFKGRLDRYKYFERYPGSSQEEYREHGMELLRDWDGRIQKNQGSLLEGGVRLVDVALFPFVRQFAGVNREWFDASDVPSLVLWLRGFLDGELFRKIMAKVPEFDAEREAEEGPTFFRFDPEETLETIAVPAQQPVG